MNDNKKLSEWSKNVSTNMENFFVSLTNLKSKTKYCYAYGAPTKASLLYKVSKLNQDDISFIVEDNKLKSGKFLSKNCNSNCII